MEVDIGVVPQWDFGDCSERKRSALNHRARDCDTTLSTSLASCLLAHFVLTRLGLRRSVTCCPLHDGQT